MATLLVCAGTAHANQPWWAYHDVVEDQHTRWSYVPLLSYHAGGSSEDDGVVHALGLHLRWRHGVSRSHTAPPRKDPIRLLVFGLGVETDRFETLEPSAAVGFQALPYACPCWGKPMWLGVKLELAGGYRWADADRAPFASVKAGLGAVFARPVPTRPGAYFKSHEVRFRSEIDVVAKAAVDLDGRWTIVGGIELDPTRLVQDVRATLF